MAQQIAVAARAIVPSRMLRLTTTEARVPVRTRIRVAQWDLSRVHFYRQYRSLSRCTVTHSSSRCDDRVDDDTAARGVFHRVIPPPPPLPPPRKNHEASPFASKTVRHQSTTAGAVKRETKHRSSVVIRRYTRTVRNVSFAELFCLNVTSLVDSSIRDESIAFFPALRREWKIRRGRGWRMGKRVEGREGGGENAFSVSAMSRDYDVTRVMPLGKSAPGRVQASPPYAYEFPRDYFTLF